MFQTMMIFLFLFLFSFLINSQKYIIINSSPTKNGFKGLLSLSNQNSSSSSSSFPSPPCVIKDLSFEFFFETKSRLRLRIYDTNQPRWEVPDVVLSSTPEISPSDMNYHIRIPDVNDIFSFQIIRESDQMNVYNTYGQEMFFADQYIELTTNLNNNDPNIYGLGERIHNFRLNTNNQVYPIFARDQGTPYQKNLYGSHPFYMEVDNVKGDAYGVFYVNSNAQNFWINGPERFMKWRTIGGVIDIFFFMGEHPKDVIKQYMEVIGKPFLPPVWSLGYHQCRWGYNTIDETKEVVENFKKNGIPLETMWNDIDYMEDYKNFIVDNERFNLGKFQEFVKEMNDNDQHYMNIIDIGIKNETGYFPYDEGIKRNVFIKKNDGVTPLTNKVWPGYTNFPMWNEEGKKYWSDMIVGYLKELPLSGIWIDMNEIAGFCDGECDQEINRKNTKKLYDKHGYRKDFFQIKNFDPMHPPYSPTSEDLNIHTIRMDAISDLGVEYNHHSLYGHHESMATQAALKEFYPNKRPFVVTRSTFAGTGHYVAHWLGDNESTFNDLFMSISGILSMSLFGISVTGGFGGDTNAEMCTRWMQLGSFYTFMRNHNAIGSISQEPYALGDTLINVSKKVILNRYSLIPYYYTLLFQAHKDGEIVIRPIIFEFTHDESGLLPFLDKQFMVGGGLMVSPIVDERVTTLWFYVPDAVWYDYYTGDVLKCEKKKMCSLNAPIDHIHVHVRGGYTISRRKPGMTTAATLRNDFDFIIALGDNGLSEGYLVFDDGISSDTLEKEAYSSLFINTKFDGKKYFVTNQIEKSNYVEGNTNLKDIFVYGVNNSISTVVINGKEHTDFIYDGKYSVLTINNIEINIIEKMEIVFF